MPWSPLSDADSALVELTRAVGRVIDGHRDVIVGRSRTGDQSKECLVLTVEPPNGPCRYLRIHSTDAAEPDWRYALLWSSYRAVDASDNCDGRSRGDLQRTLDAIQHWIIDGMRWQDVPEFGTL